MSYLTNTIKYKEYMLNNIKYIMVTIEYMYLNFLNKRIGNVDNSFHLNLIDCSTYVNLVNITYFLSEVKNGMSVVKKYMMYDTNNKYIEDKKRIGQQLIDEISKNKEMINICIKDLTNELDKQIIINNYKELVDDIFKNRS